MQKLSLLILYLLCLAIVISPALGAPHIEEPAPLPQTGQVQTSPQTEEPETDAATAPPSETQAQETDPIPSNQTISVYLTASDTTTEMPMEEYLTRAVMAEIPHTYHIEAIKAQAVAARTYCLYRMQSGQGHEGSKAGICTDYAHCMAYLSEEEAKDRWGEENAQVIYDTVLSAVRATSGECLIYDGNLIAALFHSSSRANTESAKNVWGNEYPYLVSVPSAEDAEKSEVKIALSELNRIVREKGTPDYSASLWGDSSRISVRKNDSGRVKTLVLNGYVISANTLRSALSLKSTDFTVQTVGDNAVFTVHGYGHGVGMSQNGANAMANEGKTYREILLHYYQGCEISVAA